MPTSKRSSKQTAKKHPRRQRLSPAVRTAQIIDSAAKLIVEQGYLPLAIETLAQTAGSSKALIYTYFSEQESLFNALLERELNGLLAAGLDTASQIDNLEQASVLCAQLYFEHVARYGPLLHILLSDRYMSDRIDRRLLAIRNRVLQRLARLAQQRLSLGKREALASLEMMIAIPEEAGRLAFHQEIDVNVARQMCKTLISSSLRALSDPDRALSGVQAFMRAEIAIPAAADG